MPRASSAAEAGWWGEGAPPWERWPDASLRLEGCWSAERERWESPCGLYYYDAERGTAPEDFFRRYLRHTKGEWAGQPFELLDWQKLLVTRPLFGWLRVDDGLRRFRKCFVEIPKKCGKSGLASGLGLYLFSADGEEGAEVYAAAGDEDQARIVFGESAAMALANPRYLSHAGVEVLKRAIVQRRTHSSFRVISSRVGTKHGFNVHGLIFDEFHNQPTRELYDALYRGTSARRQPIVAILTTAGSDRQSICYEEHEYGCGVRDGTKVDPTYLSVLFAAKPEDDWTDPEVWARANPSLGTTKKLEYMQAECAAAQSEPRKRNSFLNLDLNLWTESRTVWIAPEQFERLKRPEREPAFLDGLTCCVGLDLSHKVDLAACVAAFKESDAGPSQEVQVAGADAREDEPKVVLVDYRVHLVEWYWIPESGMRDRIRNDRVPYDVWAREGWVTATPGDMIHYGAIYRHVLDLHRRYKPVAVGYDPWSAQDLAQRLLDEEVPMVEVRQGYASLSGASKLLEALVRAGRVSYSGSPVTRWCVANCEIDSDPAGNIKPVKPDPKGPRRIDGVAAAVIALSRLMVAPAVEPWTGVQVIRW